MGDLISRKQAIQRMIEEIEVTQKDFIHINEIKRLLQDVDAIEAVPIDEILRVVKETYHNFSGYDLEHMTKYGNETAEQQHQSYSSLMMYEIAGEFDDLIDRIVCMEEGAE